MAKRKQTREVPRTLSIKRTKTLPVDVVQDAEIAKLKKQVRLLKSSPEVLNVDTQDFTEVSYDADNTTLLSSISVGTGGSGNRIGRSVKPKMIEIRGHVYQPKGASGITECPSVRILLLQSKQRFVPATNLSTPGSTGIFDANAGGSAYSPFGAFDPSNRQHFTVLHDELVSIGYADSSTGSIGAPSTYSFHIKRPVYRKIDFEDSSTTPESGALYLCFTSTTIGTAIGPEVRWYSRLTYTDA